MTSKDVFSFQLSDDWGGVILIGVQSRYSQAGPVTRLLKGATAGRAKKIFPAHSSRLLKPTLLPPLTVRVTAYASSSAFVEGEAAGNMLSVSQPLFETTPPLSQSQNRNTFSHQKNEVEF